MLNLDNALMALVAQKSFGVSWAVKKQTVFNIIPVDANKSATSRKSAADTGAIVGAKVYVGTVGERVAVREFGVAPRIGEDSNAGTIIALSKNAMAVANSALIDVVGAVAKNGASNSTNNFGGGSAVEAENNANAINNVGNSSGTDDLTASDYGCSILVEKASNAPANNVPHPSVSDAGVIFDAISNNEDSIAAEKSGNANSVKPVNDYAKHKVAKAGSGHSAEKAAQSNSSCIKNTEDPVRENHAACAGLQNAEKVASQLISDEVSGFVGNSHNHVNTIVSVVKVALQKKQKIEMDGAGSVHSLGADFAMSSPSFDANTSANNIKKMDANLQSNSSDSFGHGSSGKTSSVALEDVGNANTNLQSNSAGVFVDKGNIRRLENVNYELSQMQNLAEINDSIISPAVELEDVGNANANLQSNSSDFVGHDSGSHISVNIDGALGNPSAKKAIKMEARASGVNVGKPDDVIMKISSMQELRAAIDGLDCSLKKMATKTVFADGVELAPVMIIGEAPGQEEDLAGVPFCGKSGKLLDAMFAAIGITREKNLYISNAVFWRPPANRKPTKEEMDLCRPFVEKHIALIKPQLLIACGSTAFECLTGSSEPIGKQVGIMQQYSNAYLGSSLTLTAVFHPSFLLRSPLHKKHAWLHLLKIKDWLRTNGHAL